MYTQASRSSATSSSPEWRPRASALGCHRFDSLSIFMRRSSSQAAALRFSRKLALVLHSGQSAGCTIPLPGRSVAKALTVDSGLATTARPVRTILPSTAMLPLKAPTILPTQRRKALSNCFGSRTRKTRRNVSSEETSFVSTRNLRNYVSFARAQNGMSSTSANQTTGVFV